MGLRKHYYNKASGSDGNPAEFFQIIKDVAGKYNMSANLENSAVATGIGKYSFDSKSMLCGRS